MAKDWTSTAVPLDVTPKEPKEILVYKAPNKFCSFKFKPKVFFLRERMARRNVCWSMTRSAPWVAVRPPWEPTTSWSTESLKFPYCSYNYRRPRCLETFLRVSDYHKPLKAHKFCMSSTQKPPRRAVYEFAFCVHNMNYSTSRFQCSIYQTWADDRAKCSTLRWKLKQDIEDFARTLSE